MFRAIRAGLALASFALVACGRPSSSEPAGDASASAVSRGALPRWTRDLVAAQRDADPTFDFVTNADRLQATTGALHAAIERDVVVLDAGSLHGTLRVASVADRPAPAVTAIQTGENRVERRRGSLVEWYVNGPLGLEQGFVVEDAGGRADLVIELATEGLIPEARGEGVVLSSSTQATQAIQLTSLAANDEAGTALPARFEVAGASIRMHVDVRGARFPVYVDPLFSLQTRLAPSSATTSAFELGAAAISGTRVLVGAAGQGLFAFTRGASGTFSQATLSLREPAGAVAFGRAVAIDGTFAFAHRYHVALGEHSVEPYTLGAAGWIRGAAIRRTDDMPEFGTALRAKNKRLVVGAPGIIHYGSTREDGEVFLYRYDTGLAPTLITKFNPVSDVDAALGSSVDFEDDVTPFTIVAGAPGSGGHGRVYQISVSGSSASSPYRFAPVGADAQANMQFGAAVAIDGNVVAVGAPRAAVSGNAAVGQVFVYRRPTSTGAFALLRKLEPPASTPNQWFGASVALRGDLLAVGAPATPTSYAQRGAVHLYRIGASGVTFDRTITPAVSPMPEKLGRFGHTVALDADLAVGAWGGDRPNAFVHRRGLGEACATNGDCASGFCTEGVCCNAACGEACRSCLATNTGGTDGTCTNVKESTDPKGACGGGYCAAGACAAKKGLGAACNAAGECTSGFCNPEKVCCDTACTGACQSCKQAVKGSGLDGACGPIPGGVAPRVAGACPKGASYPLDCSADGLCDGAGACRTVAPSGTSCSPSGTNSCVGGVVTGQVCDGINKVCAVRSESCGDYACNAAGTACNVKCTTDAECKSGFRCNAVGTCVARSPNGEDCGGDAECESGRCVDGVCCNDTCGGQCQACNEPGSKGKCQPVNGAPRGARPACDGDGGECGGYCNGAQTDSCFYPPTTKLCGETCTDGQITRSACDAKGRCVAGAADDCPQGLACEGATCRTVPCTTAAHCRSGYDCNAGKCVPAGTSKCSDDLRESVSTVTSERVACGAFLCDPTRGTCREICAASDECAPGATCDVSSRLCVASGSTGDDGGGCAFGPPARGSWVAGLLAVSALGLASRRRRRA